MSMPPAPRRRRPAASALFATLLGALCVGAAAPARAQSVTLNFNSLTVTDGSGVRNVDNCYQESGFQITAVGVACGTPNAFATVDATAPTLWTGSPALYLNDPTATDVRFSRVDGGLFSMQSIDFAPFFYKAMPGSVTLTGFLMGGGTVSQMCGVPATAGITATQQPLMTCTLGAMFTGLTAVSFTAVSATNVYLAEFDNVRVTATATAVPEPASVALVAGGLLGVAAAARRRARPRA